MASARETIKAFLAARIPEEVTSAEERSFVSREVTEWEEYVAQISMVMGGLFSAVGIVINPFLFPQYIQLLIPHHLGILIYIGFWAAVIRPAGLPCRHSVYALHLVTVAFFAYVLYETQGSSTALADAVLASNTLLGMAGFLTVLCPFHGVIPTLTVVWYATCIYFGYQWAPRSTPLVYIGAFVLVLAWIFQRANFWRAYRTAMDKFRIRELAAENERLQIEREFAAAQKIQDSLAPPASDVYGKGVVVRFFQKKHQKVGGDWMGIRELSDGRLVVAVADATGKGIHAALVMHAVQSLWAEALGDDHFEPETWLRRVNMTLHRMGATTPHTTTAGLAVVSEDALEYWSAGHLPVFVNQGGPEETALFPVLAAGTILGVWPEAVFTPARVPLDPKAEIELIFGTDGLFTRGTLHKPADIMQFFDTLKNRPERIFELGTDEDDRSLVWIQRPAA